MQVEGERRWKHTKTEMVASTRRWSSAQGIGWTTGWLSCEQCSKAVLPYCKQSSIYNACTWRNNWSNPLEHGADVDTVDEKSDWERSGCGCWGQRYIVVAWFARRLLSRATNRKEWIELHHHANNLQYSTVTDLWPMNYIMLIIGLCMLEASPMMPKQDQGQKQLDTAPWGNLLLGIFAAEALTEKGPLVLQCRAIYFQISFIMHQILCIYGVSPTLDCSLYVLLGGQAI